MADNIASGGQLPGTAMRLRVVPGPGFEPGRPLESADFKGAALPSLINALKFFVRHIVRGPAAFCLAFAVSGGQVN